jgi:hypothetical protein
MANKKRIPSFVGENFGKTLGKHSFGKVRKTPEDNIRLNLRERSTVNGTSLE